MKRSSLEYGSWLNMRNRCYNPKCPSYKDYGGRGITVCDRWRHSFKNFIQDMGYRPEPQYSLDRIDNDGNYEPNNCRWATAEEQLLNTRARLNNPKKLQRMQQILQMLSAGIKKKDIAEAVGLHRHRLWKLLKLYNN